VLSNFLVPANLSAGIDPQVRMAARCYTWTRVARRDRFPAVQTMAKRKQNRAARQNDFVVACRGGLVAAELAGDLGIVHAVPDCLSWSYGLGNGRQPSASYSSNRRSCAVFDLGAHALEPHRHDRVTVVIVAATSASTWSP